MSVVVLTVYRVRAICTMLKDEPRESMHNIMRIGPGKKQKTVFILDTLNENFK